MSVHGASSGFSQDLGERIKRSNLISAQRPHGRPLIASGGPEQNGGSAAELGEQTEDVVKASGSPDNECHKEKLRFA